MKALTQWLVSFVLVVSLVLTPLSASGMDVSPFVGEWLAFDIDGSEIRLTIAGGVNDLFQITWTESYISFCQDGKGIVRGEGWTDPFNPNWMDAELTITCFLSQTSDTFHVRWRYDPATDTIAYPEPDPVLMTWYRRGNPIPQPAFNIIAHPDQEWVEGMGFDEGSVVSLRIYDAQHTELYRGIAVSTPDDYGVVRTEFYLEFDLKSGDHLWMTDGRTLKKLVVSSLAISWVNQDDRLVSGTAVPRSDVLLEYATAAGSPNDVFATVTTGRDGVWTASIEGMAPTSYGLVSQQDADGDLTRLGFYLPYTHFVVFPEWEWFDGLDWPDGSTVQISVEGKSECSLERESWGGFFNGSFPPNCNLVIGDLVTFTDGTITRTHRVRSLAVTGVDQEEDTVAGTADEGALIFVWPHDGWFNPLEVTAGIAGEWMVDLGDAGYDIVPGAAGRSEIRDDFGNATAVDWYAPNPRMVIFPEWEFFDGIDWPDGQVMISVDGKPECSIEKTSSGGFFNGNFPEGCNIVVGDTVRYTAGVQIREHTVRNLAVTGIDVDGDTIYGTADAGQVVFVWPHETGQQVELTADDTGNWSASFSGMYDLVTGKEGRSVIRDEWNNETAVDWRVPNPRVVANMSEDWIWMQDFMPNAPLQLMVTAPDGTTWQPEGIWTDGSGQRWIDFAEHGMDLAAGFHITVTDGSFSRSLVLEEITFDVMDVTNGHVEGSAVEPYGRDVWIGIGFPDGSGWDRLVQTGLNGWWTAEFDAPIPVDYAWAAAQIFDEDGDVSEVRPSQILGVWVGVYTLDLEAGAWSEGAHSYYLSDSLGNTGGTVNFTASSEIPMYEGRVLLRGFGLRAWTGSGCEEVGAVHPDQPTRFLSGWTSGEPMLLADAQAYFDGLGTFVSWDGGAQQSFSLREIRLFSGETWPGIVCAYTQEP